ncbi:hypothetical protein [Paenibacillus periandrae]|uniref:hypothetical protein n=1 Tax=Paenibacillus periandrae TaxID=1761741 RepID=UPI001F09ED30|nr:hypothetical protein [Paenibacillus periandrae]
MPQKPSGVNAPSQAQPAAPQANASNLPVEDKYAGKVFVSGKDIFEAVMVDSTDIALKMNTTSKNGIPNFFYDNKNYSIDKSDFYFYMDTQEGYWNVEAIKSFIPSKYLENMPKYQIVNNTPTKK